MSQRTPAADPRSHPDNENEQRPLTGQEFLDSLRDDREVWIYGERVKDVTRHPAFRNSARMLARMYDALHDPQKAPTLSTPTDTGNGGFTHKFYKVPKSTEDLVGSRDAIAEWARISYGWMGRSPDYKASLTGTLGANAEFYAPYQDNALRWYRHTQERCLFLNHSLVTPPCGQISGRRQRRLCAGGKRNRRGCHRQWRQGGRDRLCPDASQFHRLLRANASGQTRDGAVCHDSHGQRGRQADLSPVV